MKPLSVIAKKNTKKNNNNNILFFDISIHNGPRELEGMGAASPAPLPEGVPSCS